jgi:hypothetical protein
VLRILLDEHVSPAIAEQLSRHRPEIIVVSLQQWEGGAYRGAPDPDLLAAAAAQGWTLLTYDRRTLAPLLKVWGETGVTHAGVIFVDERTIASNDLGGLVHALLQLWEAQAAFDWTDRVVFLTR